MNVRYLFVAALMASALPGQFRPGGPPRQPPTPRKEYKPEELCVVSGFVRSGSTGEPLSKASVTIASSGRSQQNHGASTDATGRFTVNGIEPGQYRISVRRNGYVTSEQSGRRAVSPGSTLTLSSGQALKSVEVKLIPHAVVTGRIYDNDGDPILHANVQLMGYRYNQQGRRELASSGFAQTNDLGEYRLFGVPPGKYFVGVTAQGRGGPFGMDTGTDREAGAESPVPTYYPAAAEPAHATQIDVPMGASLQGIDVRVLRARTFRVSGQIAGAPSERRQGMVMLIPAGGRDSAPQMMRGMMGGPSRPDGKFTVSGVTPGTYTIVADSSDGNNNRMRGTAEVVVGDRNVDNAQVILQPSFDLAGAVRLDGQGTADFSGIMIMLEPRESGGRFGGRSAEKVDAAGKITLHQMSAGPYDLMANGLPENHFIKAVRIGEADALAAGARIQTGMQLDIVVSPNGGRISGGVANEKGEAVRSANVILMAPGAPPIHRFKSASADQQGQFSLSGIAPGDYYLFAIEENEAGVYWEPEFLKKNEKLIEKVSIREGATASKTLKLISPGE